MTTYRETVKSALLNYPSLYKDKFGVNHQLFATIGNGFEWSEEGTLEKDYHDPREDTGNKMRFEDLDERKQDIHGRNSPLEAMFVAEIESLRILREFTEKHIDLLLDNSCSHSFFSNSCGNYKLSTYMKVKYVSYDYARIFNYPDNIQKDWAIGMEDFISVWLVGLNYEYGVGQHADMNVAIKHWPDEAKTLRARLVFVQEDLLTKITGKDTVTRRTEEKEWLNKIWETIDESP